MKFMIELQIEACQQQNIELHEKKFLKMKFFKELTCFYAFVSYGTREKCDNRFFQREYAMESYAK